jgi:hypothetical protein
MTSLIKPHQACIVIEGPNWSERSRLLKWLSAAASLNFTLKGSDWPPEHSDLLWQVDFADAAIRFVTAFTNKQVVVSVRSPLACEFALLAKLGFFVLEDGRYRFSTPENEPDADRIIDLVAQLDETANGEALSPERLIATQASTKS